MTLADAPLLIACIAAGILVAAFGVIGLAYIVTRKDETLGNVYLLASVSGIIGLGGMGWGASYLVANGLW